MPPAFLEALPSRGADPPRLDPVQDPEHLEGRRLERPTRDSVHYRDSPLGLWFADTRRHRDDPCTVGIVTGAAGGDIAYYYPEPYWLMGEGGWIKSLLLCFDKVGVLLPEYMLGIETEADPVLAGPLVESGHLVIVHPETFVDTELTEQLTEAMVELISAGACDDVESRSGFAELSMSRMGFYGDPGLFEMVFDELKRRGLARATADGVSIPLHPVVRRVYLLLLAQFARQAGARHGLNLHPTTNLRGVGPSLANLLQTHGAPSKGHVVEFDLNTIGVDLDAVPLDEIFDFRRQHHDEHKRYMRNLRQFVGELAMADDEERPSLYEERASELREDAHNLVDRRSSSVESAFHCCWLLGRHRRRRLVRVGRG